jgi:hypothetical protein
VKLCSDLLERIKAGKGLVSIGTKETFVVISDTLEVMNRRIAKPAALVEKGCRSKK